MEIALSTSFRTTPNSVGVPYTSEGVMARRIVPFAEVLDIVERDSYLEEDSSGDEDLHLNPHPSIEDGTTLPLEDIASISRAFGTLIPPCERDSLLVLDEDLAEEDEVGFDGERTLESSEEEDQPGFSGSVVQEHGESDEISEFVGDLWQSEDKQWAEKGHKNQQFLSKL